MAANRIPAHVREIVGRLGDLVEATPHTPTDIYKDELPKPHYLALDLLQEVARDRGRSVGIAVAPRGEVLVRITP